MIRATMDRLLARPWLALIAALAVHTALWLAAQDDLSPFDPLWYADSAGKLAFHAGALFVPHNGSPFATRLGLLAPIALAYRLVGVSALATNLPCLLAGLGVHAIAYAAVPTPRGKLLAVLFAATCTPLLVDAHDLNPDLPCAAMMGASLLCLTRRDRPRGAAWLVAAAVLWFAAFQVKEVAVWCAPAWIYAAIRDLRDRGSRWAVHAFGPAVGVGAGLAAGYLVFCAVLWRDPLVRFHGIENMAGQHGWELVGHAAGEWVARLTWQPAVMLYKMFGVLLVPAVLSPWLVRDRGRIWVVATAAILLLYWFGSGALGAYLPLPLRHRMILPVLPGLIIVAALASDVAIDAVQRWIRDPRWRIGLGAASVLILAVPYVRAVHKQLAGIEHPEHAAYEALHAEFAGASDRGVVLVCGDYRCPPLTGFYFGFAPPPNLSVEMPDAFAAAPLPAGARVWVLTHISRSNGAGRDVARRADALGLPRIGADPELRLYDAGDGARLHDALARP